MGVLPAHGVTTLFHLLSRARDATAARRSIADLVSVLEIAAVDETVVRRALSLGWGDFADAVCAAAAEAARCDALVTRDPVGFPRSPVRVLTPEAALALLPTEPQDRVGEPAAYGVPTRRGKGGSVRRRRSA